MKRGDGQGLKKKKSPAVIQESQLVPLIGINLCKKQCNFQEFSLKPIAIAYHELCKPFLQDQYDICRLMADFFQAFL